MLPKITLCQDGSPEHFPVELRINCREESPPVQVSTTLAYNFVQGFHSKPQFLAALWLLRSLGPAVTQVLMLTVCHVTYWRMMPNLRLSLPSNHASSSQLRHGGARWRIGYKVPRKGR